MRGLCGISMKSFLEDTLINLQERCRLLGVLILILQPIMGWTPALEIWVLNSSAPNILLESLIPTAGISNVWHNSAILVIGSAPSDNEYSVLFVRCIKSATVNTPI